MDRKAYFQERTEAEMVRLDPKQIYSARGLVDRIMHLGDNQVMEVRTNITPGKFFRGDKNGEQASRKCYKHGDLVALTQPKTVMAALGCRDIPLAIRARDFAELETMREEDINFVGYSWYPVQGNDARKRIVPFVWVPEAVRLFAYAENLTGGIEVKPYADSARVQKEGATVICNVPSRTVKKSRYEVKLKHVPVDGSTERRVVAWSLTSEFGSKAPEHSTYNIRYTWASEREHSDVFTFYPQDIAAYIATIKHFWNQHNLTPFEMSPLALPSNQTAEFYRKLCNNVLIFDSTLGKKGEVRKLHLDEKSILIGRSIGVYGAKDTMYFDPERDGKLKDYNFSLR